MTEAEQYADDLAAKYGTEYTGRALEIFKEGCIVSVLEYSKWCNERDLQKFPVSDFLTGDFYYF